MKFQPAEENKIIIKKNPNGDNRTAPKDVTFDQEKGQFSSSSGMVKLK